MNRPDPIHCHACPADVAWSTINAGEAIPGVVTPLTWSFFGDATERAIKQTFCDLGAMRPDEVYAAEVPQLKMWDVFYGRAAGNLNMFRYVGDRMPGTSGDAIEEQIFGQVRAGVKSDAIWSRYPVVAVKMPRAALNMTKALNAAVAPVKPWWQQTVAPGALTDARAAREALKLAASRFEKVMVPHTLAAMLCQAMYEQLRRLSQTAGRPGLELSLITGYGQMAETDVVADLWAVSRERLTLGEFIRRHGYHGPDEGEISSAVWRVNPEPLHALLKSYAQLPDDRDPRQVEHDRGTERERAEQELLQALPKHRRAPAKLVLKLAAKMIPLRGTGKAAFLQCVDVARTAAHAIGEELAQRGVLDKADDAFMLTVDELAATAPPAGIKEKAQARRAKHDEYRKLDIPDLFYGVPEPFPFDRGESSNDDPMITGAPVSPGVVEGVARRLVDPHSDETLEPGEILVCRTTDPSWVSVMLLASALVIDIGGPISHGAIVARELGIPCVIGTRDGSARIATGDVIRVDGAKGEVEIVSRGEATPLEPEPVEAATEPEPAEPEHAQPETRSTDPMANEQLAVLRALRLKGRASTDDLATATGLDATTVEPLVQELIAAEQAREMRGAYMLMPAAKQRLEELLAQERETVDTAAIVALYDQFTPVNHDFKALANDWQTRSGEPNDHTDAAYDQTVLDRLPGIDERVQPIAQALGEQAPRLKPYAARMTNALQRTQHGEHEWLLKPLIDSYHTVWFELHEELISLAGLTRLEEAVAGRAH